MAACRACVRGSASCGAQRAAGLSELRGSASCGAQRAAGPERGCGQTRMSCCTTRRRLLVVPPQAARWRRRRPSHSCVQLLEDLSAAGMGGAGVDLDAHVTYSLVPQNPDQVQPSHRVSQKLLLMLVSLVLCGISIEAYFISHFYRAVSELTSNDTSGRDGPSVVLPSKSLAHLKAGPDVVHERQILHWSDDTLLRDMGYRQGRLVVQTEGLYFVYSKVSFMKGRMFRHCLMLTSPHHGAAVTLLQSWTSSPSSPKQDLSNSYLGGVFHLCKGCSVFVKVSNASNILQEGTHSFFGAFMI
ncbi:tumor necrosis factor ligand superfamily member 14-like [Trachinotus anak]|uniref:tumor necrosis factor ligand superfamily member 14-like n=1 Tax=Trachinotus anak TaxID=443729 RepID=UPI0039F24AE6